MMFDVEKGRCTYPVENNDAVRLFCDLLTKCGHIWTHKVYNVAHAANRRWILGVGGVDVAIVQGISTVFRVRVERY